MRFVPRFDSLESKISLSDAISTWTSSDATTNLVSITVVSTVSSVVPSPVPSAVPSIDVSTPPIVLVGGIDGTMPTTPGVNLDIYPPVFGYGGALIPQVPVSPQDPSGIFGVPFPQKYPLVPSGMPNPAPYFPPPYGVPTYVGLSSVPVTPIS